jgi:vacuolar-type H+-ATPase subunit I/STV1
LNVIEKALNSIKDKLFPAKNLVIQDVNGIEIDFGDEVETSDQIQVGSTATVDGSPAEGEYTLSDGTVYVFEGGSITEIREPEGEEEEAEEMVDELQEEVNNLTEENKELQNKLKASDEMINKLKEEAKQVKDELIAEISKVQNEFIEFKNKFSSEKPDLNGPGGQEEDGERKNKFTFKSKSKN